MAGPMTAKGKKTASTPPAKPKRRRTTQQERMDQASDIVAHVHAHGLCECWVDGVTNLKDSLAAQWSQSFLWPDNGKFVEAMYLGCGCGGKTVRLEPPRLRIVRNEPLHVDDEPVYGWKEDPRDELTRERSHDLGLVLDTLEVGTGRFRARLARAYDQWSTWSRTQIWASALAWYWGVDGDRYAHAVNKHREAYERKVKP